MRDAAAVLSDSALFRLIAGFQTGYPHAVAAIVETASKTEIRDALRIVYTSDGKDKLVGVLPRLAIVKGSLQTLRFLFDLKTRVEYESDPMLQFVDVMQLAVRLKRVDMLECLAELKHRDPAWQWEKHLMSYAAGYGGGDLRVLEWLYAHLPQEMRALRAEYLVPPVRRGNIEEIQWLVEHHYEFTSYAADCAALDEETNVLGYLYQHTRARCSARAVCQAAANGTLEVVKVTIAEQPEEMRERALECAARYGYLQVVQYLVENRLGETSSRAIDSAAQEGHLNIVKFLHKHIAGGCTTQAMDGAAANGHLDIIKFLHDNRYEGCTPNAMDAAAASGHLDVVRFLHENRSEGCLVEAMDRAAEFGHLDVVKFLHENRNEGCTARALRLAVANMHLEIVEFLCKHRCEGDITAAMVDAASAGHLNVVKVLHSHRRSQDSAYPALKAAAQKYKVEIVKFLCENQCRDREVGAAGDHEEERSFLMKAVTEGTSWVVQAVVPYSSMAELKEARIVALSRQEPRIIRVLDRGIRELTRMERRT